MQGEPVEVGNHPRSRKGVQTRARLIDAAKLVFEQDGFLDARVADIVNTAGLAPGSFYHYFDSKEQIFREVAAVQEDRLTAPSHVALASDEESPFERIRRSIRGYFERYRDEAALMGVIEQVSRYDEQVNMARMATMTHFVEQSEHGIRQMKADGLVDPRVEPSIAADALSAMMNRFAELWLVQGYRAYDFDEAMEQLTVLLANALGLVAEEVPHRL